jgi:hypothetical protein
MGEANWGEEDELDIDTDNIVESENTGNDHE